MKILTVQPPWAAAIFAQPFPKTIENRVWYTSLRQERIGIHAGLRVDRNAGIPIDPNALRGFVLGTVEITGCHEAGSQQCVWHDCSNNAWAQWPDADHPVLFHWELEHPREFVSPIRARGALKLWDAGPSVEHLMSIADVIIPESHPVSALPEPIHVLEIRYARCGACEYLGEHPNRPHSWADAEDIAHAAATGQPEPTETCACPCAKEQP